MNNPILMKQKNINGNCQVVCREEKNKSYFKLFLFFFVLLIAGQLFAQSNSDSNTVKVVAAKNGGENLNVFQQWIRWNNPGSLAINHLTRQAYHYYKIRDEQIAKLKTKSDWQ